MVAFEQICGVMLSRFMGVAIVMIDGSEKHGLLGFKLKSLLVIETYMYVIEYLLANCY